MIWITPLVTASSATTTLAPFTFTPTTWIVLKNNEERIQRATVILVYGYYLPCPTTMLTLFPSTVGTAPDVSPELK